MPVPPFTPKDWKDLPDQSTPISAAALEEMETRLANYAVSAANSIPVGPAGPPGTNGTSGLPSGWIDITVAPYNCVGDAVTDNTAGLQAALDYVKTNKGTIYVPKGNYCYRYLLAENTYGWTMMGAGPCQQYQSGPSHLRCIGVGDIRAEFIGAKASLNQSQMTISTTNLTGKTGPGGLIRTYLDGSAGHNDQQQITILATGGTYTLTFGGNTTTALAFDATPATVQAALEALPSIGVGNISCYYKGGSGFMIARSSDFHLVDMGFDYSNANFHGHILNIDGGFNGTEDCQDFSIERCSSRDLIGTNPALSSIRLSRAIIASMEACHWTGAEVGVRISDPGGQFVNSFQIEKCTFNDFTDAQILVGSVDGEMITIRDCCFEAGINTTAIRGTTAALDGGQNQTYTIVIENNWFGDSSGGQVWIDEVSAQSNSYFGVIKGNRFSGVGAAGTNLNLRGKWLIEGNSFEGGTAFSSSDPSHFGGVSMGNHYNVTTVWDPVAFPLGAPDTILEMGNTSRIGLLSSAPVYVGAGAVDNTVRSNLILAGANVDPGTVQKSAVFHGTVPTTSRRMIGVQAPWNGSSGDGQLLAGAGPTPVVAWQDRTLGFFAATPVALPSATGVAVGFTAGAGTAVNDQSTFTGGVGIVAPVPTAAAVASGGAFAAGTYFYKVSSTNAAGESLPSVERSVVVVLNGSVTLTWNQVPGATGYRIYRATGAGGENVSPALVTVIGSGSTLTYTDTGGATSAGAVLAVSTALTAYRISDIVKHLKNLGLIAG